MNKRIASDSFSTLEHTATLNFSTTVNRAKLRAGKGVSYLNIGEKPTLDECAEMADKLAIIIMSQAKICRIDADNRSKLNKILLTIRSNIYTEGIPKSKAVLDSCSQWVMRLSRCKLLQEKKRMLNQFVKEVFQTEQSPVQCFPGLNFRIQSLLMDSKGSLVEKWAQGFITREAHHIVLLSPPSEGVEIHTEGLVVRVLADEEAANSVDMNWHYANQSAAVLAQEMLKGLQSLSMGSESSLLAEVQTCLDEFGRQSQLEERVAPCPDFEVSRCLVSRLKMQAVQDSQRWGWRLPHRPITAEQQFWLHLFQEPSFLEYVRALEITPPTRRDSYRGWIVALRSHPTFFSDAGIDSSLNYGFHATLKTVPESWTALTDIIYNELRNDPAIEVVPEAIKADALIYATTLAQAIQTTYFEEIARQKFIETIHRCLDPEQHPYINRIGIKFLELLAMNQDQHFLFCLTLDSLQETPKIWRSKAFRKDKSGAKWVRMVSTPKHQLKNEARGWLHYLNYVDSTEGTKKSNREAIVVWGLPLDLIISQERIVDCGGLTIIEAVGRIADAIASQETGGLPLTTVEIDLMLSQIKTLIEGSPKWYISNPYNEDLNECGLSVLKQVCKCENAKLLRELINWIEWGDVNFQKRNEIFSTLLLANPKNPDLLDFIKLYLPAYECNTLFCTAAQCGAVEILAWGKENGGVFLLESLVDTPLKLAIAHGHTDCLGVLVDLQDPNDVAHVLRCALEMDRPEALTWLQDKGCDIAVLKIRGRPWGQLVNPQGRVAGWLDRKAIEIEGRIQPPVQSLPPLRTGGRQPKRNQVAPAPMELDVA